MKAADGHNSMENWMDTIFLQHKDRDVEDMTGMCAEAGVVVAEVGLIKSVSNIVRLPLNKTLSQVQMNMSVPCDARLSCFARVR